MNNNELNHSSVVQLVVPDTIIEEVKKFSEKQASNRDEILKKTNEVLNNLLPLIEEEAKIKLDAKIESLENNFEENKITYFKYKTLDELKNSLMEILVPSAEKNVLVEFDREFFEAGVGELLEAFNLEYRVTWPGLYDKTSPAKIIENLNTFLSTELDDENAKKIIDFLHEFSQDSTLAITYPSGVTSETGSILVLDKYGIKGILSTAPEKQVFIIHPDRIFSDYFKMLKFYTTLSRINTGVSDMNMHIISNPSRTGDIEKIIVYGAHGPMKLSTAINLGLRAKLFIEVFDNWMTWPVSALIETAFPELKLIANLYTFPSVDPLSILSLNTTDNHKLALMILLLLSKLLNMNYLKGMNKYKMLVEKATEYLKSNFGVKDADLKKITADVNEFSKIIFK